MSLLVWLPLNGNLGNNGFNNVTVTNSSSTVSDSGKIGKCYSFSGSSQKLTSTLSSSVSSSIGSLACWVKFNAFPASGKWMCLMQLGTSGGYANCRFGMYMEYTNGINVCVDGSTTAENLYTHSLSTDTWYHLCTTYDGTDVKLYLNGEIVLSKSVTKGTYTSSATNLFIGGTNNYYLNGYLNDVRYYNHALSAKEVKEISQGLILHYPMTGGGKYGYNLAKGTNTSDTSTNTFYFSEQTGGSTRSIIDVDGVTCAKITRNATEHSGWSFLGYSNWDRAALKPSTTYTISMDVIGSGSGYVSFAAFKQGNSTNSLTASVTTISCNFNADNWSHLVYQTTTIADFTDKGTSQIIYMGCPFLTTVSTWIMMKNLKIEEGTIDTPWIPHTSDAKYNLAKYGNTTEYDVSGYHRDGTISGTIEYVTDTPRNNVCSNLIDPAYITYKLPANMYYATYAFWMKEPSFTTYGAIHMQAGNPSGGYSPWFSANTESGSLWMYLGGNSPNYCKASGSLSVDTWYHCAMVWDNGVAQWYLNGEKSGNAVTFTTKKYIDNSTNSTIGDSYTGSSWNGTPFTGQISDWRVYATALSATDIKQLYEETKSHK